MTAPSAVLCLSKDFQQGFFFERPNSSTGAAEPAAGITDLKMRWSATVGGPAIHAQVAVAAAEYAGDPGFYAPLFSSSVLRSRLATYAGQRIWLVLSWDTDTEQESFPYRVVVECG